MSRKSKESSGVEANVKLLMQELSALMLIRPEGCEEGNNRWSEILQAQELEIHSLLNEFYELRNGMGLNNMNVEFELNRKLMQLLKYVKVLRECILVETSQRDPVAEKPKSFSLEDLQSFTSKFSNQIGAGGFAKVYKGKFPDGVKVAVKVLKEGDDVEETFIAELSTIGRIHHPYLVKLYGYCFDKRMKALVYEYMEKGSFDTILYNNPHGLDWKKFYEIAVNIAEGLSYLHHGCSEPIIYHDIKTANVLIDSDLFPKITDFGLAVHMKDGASHLTNSALRGTWSFFAPGLFYPWSPATPKCDVYSYGMLLFEILGMRANDRKEEWFPKQVWKKFKAGKLDEMLGNCGISKENSRDAEILSTVALWCAQFAPKSRPSMSIVVKMLQKEMHVQRPQNPFLIYEESSFARIQEDGEEEEIYSPDSVGGKKKKKKSLLPKLMKFLRKCKPNSYDSRPKRYSRRDLATFISSFSSQVGSSAFRKVYKGNFRSGEKVTVMVLEENNVDEETFMHTVSILEKINHLHLVKFYGYCFMNTWKKDLLIKFFMVIHMV